VRSIVRPGATCTTLALVSSGARDPQDDVLQKWALTVEGPLGYDYRGTPLIRTRY
jgi:hypothetical protein